MSIDFRKNRTVDLINNSLGLLLKINRRPSPQHFRIYGKERDSKLRFEFELKKSAIKSIQQYFIDLEFDRFENTVIDLYFKFAFTVTPLNEPCLFWLMNFKRRNCTKFSSSFSTEYFSENVQINLTKDIELIYYFLQFLSFINHVKPSSLKSIQLEGMKYNLLDIPLSNFLSYIGKTKIKQYERDQVLQHLLQFYKLEPLHWFKNLRMTALQFIHIFCQALFIKILIDGDFEFM